VTDWSGSVLDDLLEGELSWDVPILRLRLGDWFGVWHSRGGPWEVVRMIESLAALELSLGFFDRNVYAGS
jgi:hypothetical protein